MYWDERLTMNDERLTFNDGGLTIYLLTLFLENDIFLYFVTFISNPLPFNMLSEVMNIFVTLSYTEIT